MLQQPTESRDDSHHVEKTCGPYMRSGELCKRKISTKGCTNIIYEARNGNGYETVGVLRPKKGSVWDSYSTITKFE